MNHVDHLGKRCERCGRCEPCGEKKFLVCGSISAATTFTTEAYQETLKIQSGTLNCDSRKVYLLKSKVSDEVT